MKHDILPQQTVDYLPNVLAELREIGVEILDSYEALPVEYVRPGNDDYIGPDGSIDIRYITDEGKQLFDAKFGGDWVLVLLDSDYEPFLAEAAHKPVDPTEPVEVEHVVFKPTYNDSSE